ncbi:MAG: hypothetical protein ACI4II_03065 [Acutalibacteraceae bacterium]
MKKIILTCTALLLTFVLFGCSNEIKYTPRDTPAKEPYKPATSNVSAVTETDAPAQDEDVYEDVVSEVEKEKTYWEKLCLDLYGIEGLTEPKNVTLFQNYSTDSTIHVEYITDKSTDIAKQLVQQAFDLLKSKNIDIYTCVHGVKGEIVKDFNSTITMESDINLLYEMIYTYNNEDMYFSAMAYVTSDPDDKNKYMRLSCYRYYPPYDESSQTE